MHTLQRMSDAFPQSVSIRRKKGLPSYDSEKTVEETTNTYSSGVVEDRVFKQTPSSSTASKRA